MGSSRDCSGSVTFVSVCRHRMATGVVFAAIFFVGGCAEDANKTAHTPPPEVGVVTIQAQPVELFTVLPGRTSPYRVAEIRPQVDGIVLERTFEEGAKVEAGQKLYQIDPKPYQAELARAKAELAAAKAAVTAVAQRAKRYAELVESHAISQQQYDNVEAELAQKQAQIKVAEARLQAARINLDYTTVESPIDGRISRSYITVGALVTGNQAQALAQVTRLDPIYVDIPRAAEDVLRLKRAFEQGRLQQAGSSPARVTLLLGDGREYAHQGKLQFSDVTVNPDTGSVTLRAKFPNPEHDLLPGMFVRVRLSEGVKNQALLVPQQAVTHDRMGQALTLVVGEHDRLEQRVLEIGRAIGNAWLVTDGLAAGDQVLVTGRQVAHAGMQVAPVPANIEPGRNTGTKQVGPAGGIASNDGADDQHSSEGAGANHD